MGDRLRFKVALADFFATCVGLGGAARGGRIPPVPPSGGVLVSTTNEPIEHGNLALASLIKWRAKRNGRALKNRRELLRLLALELIVDPTFRDVETPTGPFPA